MPSGIVRQLFWQEYYNITTYLVKLQHFPIYAILLFVSVRPPANLFVKRPLKSLGNDDFERSCDNQSLLRTLSVQAIT